MTSDPRHLSRRDFTTMTVAAGLTASTGLSAAAAPAVTVSDVQIKTAAGTCDAALVAGRGKEPLPGVILFVDAFGLRPAMRDMAKRLAGDGYTVLVPNPYYRSTPAPGIEPGFDFGNPDDRKKLEALRAPLTGAAVMQDAATYVEFLDAQSTVDKKAAMGVFGYCMGGPMTMQAAASRPDRIGAGASFHGGGVVTDKPDSPHLLVPKMRAQFYFGIAANDDEKQPDMKTKLDEAFHAAGRPVKVEVYAGCLHGWCVKDMPLQAGKPIYNEPQAERAWGELTALYRRVRV